ncbi:MAG: 2-succinyl-5-enolpyruvyl-6-hydroxy-3-cyclohexene-1-carboxylic-acid synthase, partial [FCB group bacterium]|nr:2-succinyl-5-enolpyruvyl-6-hydroxy-3-cyclohexene-1-carboxylic-acid synthase [FCB group bacterium]
MFLPAIVNIAEICARKGISNAILSPGSRCAPLTLAFARHEKINVRTVSDERSAAYIALGIAQSTQKPVVLVCTSGTAALNYAPAVTEAYYQHIPLIVITADRPPEWIDQQDGQSIHQSNLYAPHVKAGYDLPVDTAHADAAWHVERSVSDAVNCAQAFPPGPVHLNIPIREPFYPRGDETVRFDSDIRIIDEVNGTAVLDDEQWRKLVTKIQSVEKMLLVGGHGEKDSDLLEALNRLCKNADIPVVGDVITNLHPLENCVKHADIILARKDESALTDLRPDLLIT